MGLVFVSATLFPWVRFSYAARMQTQSLPHRERGYSTWRAATRKQEAGEPFNQRVDNEHGLASWREKYGDVEGPWVRLALAV